MGNLKPGAKYIYERADGVVYAREEGADPSTRIEIGYDWKWGNDLAKAHRDQLVENQLWDDIRQAAKTNPALQAELDRVIMLYHLTKEENPPVAYHPV